MIYLLHGENQVLSRQQLVNLINQAKTQGKELVELDGLKIDLNQVLQALESASLFSQEKFIVIENLLSRQPSKEKEKIISYFKKQATDLTIVFWEKKEISGTTTRWLPKTWQIKAFKTPAVIFQLLDNLKPQNTTQILSLLHACLEKGSAEIVFYMLSRRIRELIIALSLGKQGLSGAPWQLGKLMGQSQKFNLNKLLVLYKKLLAIDTDIKTGRTIMPLNWHLDLFLIDL